MFSRSLRSEMLVFLAAVSIAPLLSLGARSAAVTVHPGAQQGPGIPTSPLEPDPTRPLPADLGARMRKDPYAYFRVVNKAWAGRVCAAFTGELHALPRVRLHGDAHLEQYAFTAAANGLDDFDDAAVGPSIIDLVRFLGSVDLAVRRRGWSGQVDALFDEFFRGYRAGLRDPAYAPPTPSVVRRLRPRTARSQTEFLEWAESLMQPAGDERGAVARDSLALVARLFDAVRPGMPPGYFTLKKIGELRLGVGSRLIPKLLARVEGSSLAAEDDVVLEAKELSDLSGIDCLDVPRAGEVFRVIGGAEQLGRIRHEVLSLVPKRQAGAPETRDWWLRSWEATYGEVVIDDLASVEELKEVVHDVGAQLGSANTRERGPLPEALLRQRELEASERLEPRIRLLARQLAGELLEAWALFRERSATPPR